MFDAVYTETLSDLISDMLIDKGIYTEEELTEKTRQQRIEAVAPYLFESFPIFDENYRLVLEKKILNHYYLREIGSETPELFLYYFNRELNEQAPYFNELYRSLTFEFNPLYTVNKTIGHEGRGTNTGTRTDNLTENTTRSDQSSSTNSSTSEGSASSTGQSTSTSSGDTKSGFNDTPQGAITGIAGALDPNGSGYLTNASIGKSSSTGSSTETASSTNESETSGTTSGTSSGTGSRTNTGTQSNAIATTDAYVDHVTGYEGKPVELIKQFRENIINIDLKIINLLKSCFMQIY